MWRALAIQGLIDPTRSSESTALKEALPLLRSLKLHALHIAIPLDALYRVEGERPKPILEAWARLQAQLDLLRQDPTDAWAFVLMLSTKTAHPAAIWKEMLADLHARLAAAHIIWSLRDLPAPLQEDARRWLLKHDPYRQPIALPRLPKEMLADLPTSRPASAQAKAKKTKEEAKKTKEAPRYALHTRTEDALSISIRPFKMTPWLTEIPLEMKSQRKALMQRWWRGFLAGVSPALQLPRPLHADEREAVLGWLQEADLQESLPPHPDEKKAASSQPTSAPQSQPIDPKKSKVKATPYDQQLSRPLLHALILLHHWDRFLKDIQLSAYLRPDPVSVRIPRPAKTDKDKPSAPLPETIPMYGYLASNGLTTLYMPPDEKLQQAPSIRWKDYKIDLEFIWFNALTGGSLEKRLLRQVTGLELTKPKAEAHIAKVAVADHPINKAYLVRLSRKDAPLDPQDPLTPKRWSLAVEAPPPPPRQGQGAPQTPPKPQRLQIPFVLTESGYEARFIPHQPGFWRFRILDQGKPAQGDLGLPGQVKAMPSQLPAAILPKPPQGRFLVSRGAPFFYYSRRDLALFERKEDRDAFKKRIALIRAHDPALSVIHARLPALAWPDGDLAKEPSRLATLLRQITELDERLGLLHEAGFHTALSPDLKAWASIPDALRQKRLRFLLDRLGFAYPLIWSVDLRNQNELGEARWFSLALQGWMRERLYPDAAAPKPASPQAPPQAPQAPPLQLPPLWIAELGAPRAEKRLEEAEKGFAMLHIEIQSLEREIQDFKLLQRKRPVILAWKTAQKEGFAFPPHKVKEAPPEAYRAWARFLWQAQMMGFHHHGQDLPTPLPTPDPKRPPEEAIQLAQRIPAMLRAFFQTFNWVSLLPTLQSLKLRDHQAFGVETPPQGQSVKQEGHHVVIWVNESVRSHIELDRQMPFNKHRYLWLDPLTGQQPISPQLLPPQPKNKQPDKFQVPFRPAVLYLFQRPPDKNKGKQKQQPKPQPQQQQQQRPSERQQVRNRLKRLQEDRRDMLRKMLKQQQPPSLSGKRG